MPSSAGNLKAMAQRTCLPVAAEPLALVEVVDLDDQAVDVERQRESALGPRLRRRRSRRRWSRTP